MPTLTGRNTRTIIGYAITLLEYPRWVIEREVDFTDCHRSGNFEVSDQQCVSCSFGQACRWLNSNHVAAPTNPPLDELVHALSTAVEYFRSSTRDTNAHPTHCECDTCLWLHEATGFLRTNRHRT